MTKTIEKTQTYKIGAVSRMTGIPTDTLRVWERRYALIEPMRTPAGGRLYSQEDVNRLSVIKALVDMGDSISSIAALDLVTLKDRLDSSEEKIQASAYSQSEQSCRLVVIGESSGLHIRNLDADISNIEIVGRFNQIDGFESDVSSLHPDVLVIEIPTLHKDDAHLMLKWLRLSGAKHAFVVYRFGNAEAFRHIATSRCTLLHAPTDLMTIRQHCLALFIHPSQQTGNANPMTSHATSARKYDDETLARIVMQSTSIRCECPRHITELITSLAAFEQYSTECESLNPEDAALHTYLNQTTALAREMMESALTRVIEADNIEI